MSMIRSVLVEIGRADRISCVLRVNRDKWTMKSFQQKTVMMMTS